MRSPRTGATTHEDRQPLARKLGLGKDAEEDAGQVAVGIETDRGPWVQALTDLDTDRIHRRSVLNSLINEYTRVA
jgi:hypothetical protein